MRDHRASGAHVCLGSSDAVIRVRVEIPGSIIIIRPGDNGIDHRKNWLRFPYDSTVWRSHYLHPHPH
jgi:hypothetical protein